MKIRNKPVIMIDFGGVYFSHGRSMAIRKIAKKFGMPEKNVREVMSGRLWKKHHEGKMSSEEYWKAVSRRLNASEEKWKWMENAWHSSYKPQAGMKSLVRKLRKKYRVVVLSGNVKEKVEFLERKYSIGKEFHGHHYSFDYGVSKPDARLFKKAAKKMSLRPADCIVVDDMENFLEGVRKCGAKTILFKNAQQLEKELENLGVKA